MVRTRAVAAAGVSESGLDSRLALVHEVELLGSIGQY